MKSAYKHGLDILGAGVSFSRRPRVAYIPRPVDTISSPSSVTVNPKNMGSSVFTGNVARVVITGGAKWVPVWAKNENVYDNPIAVSVWLKDGTKRAFGNVQQVTVADGSMSTTMMGMDPAAPGTRVARTKDSIDAYRAAGVQVNQDTGTLRAVSDSYADVAWDAGGKAERGIPLSELVVVGDDAPSTGGIYNNDSDTVRAVQTALEALGFHLKKGVDGKYGPDTASAIKRMQAQLGAAQSGVIDYGVLMALKVPVPAQADASSAPSSGRPGKGWSQPQPDKMGPAVTPSSGAAAEDEGGDQVVAHRPRGGRGHAGDRWRRVHGERRQVDQRAHAWSRAVRTIDRHRLKFKNYQAGLDALMGALSLGVPKLSLDSSSSTASPSSMTPEQLSKLDRALTAEEQHRVDLWQSGQAEAMEKAEEAKPFVNPLTGQKTVMLPPTFTPGAIPPKSAPAAPKVEKSFWDSIPTWGWIAAGVVGAGLVGVIGYKVFGGKTSTRQYMGASR